MIRVLKYSLIASILGYSGFNSTSAENRRVDDIGYLKTTDFPIIKAPNSVYTKMLAAILQQSEDRYDFIESEMIKDAEIVNRTEEIAWIDAEKRTGKTRNMYLFTAAIRVKDDRLIRTFLENEADICPNRDTITGCPRNAAQTLGYMELVTLMDKTIAEREARVTKRNFETRERFERHSSELTSLITDCDNNPNCLVEIQAHLKAIREMGRTTNKDRESIGAFMHLAGSTASRRQFSKVVDILLENGYSLEERGLGGRTVLQSLISAMLSADIDGSSNILFLIQKGIDLNAVDEDNRSALWSAADCFNRNEALSLKITSLLLEHGADPNIEDVYGKTVAESLGSEKCIANRKIVQKYVGKFSRKKAKPENIKKRLDTEATAEYVRKLRENMRKNPHNIDCRIAQAVKAQGKMLGINVVDGLSCRATCTRTQTDPTGCYLICDACY